MSQFYRSKNSIYNLSKMSIIQLSKVPLSNDWVISFYVEKSLNQDFNIENNNQCVHKIIFKNKQIANQHYEVIISQLFKYLDKIKKK